MKNDIYKKELKKWNRKQNLKNIKDMFICGLGILGISAIVTLFIVAFTPVQ